MDPPLDSYQTELLPFSSPCQVSAGMLLSPEAFPGPLSGWLSPLGVHTAPVYLQAPVLPGMDCPASGPGSPYWYLRTAGKVPQNNTKLFSHSSGRQKPETKVSARSHSLQRLSGRLSPCLSLAARDATVLGVLWFESASLHSQALSSQGLLPVSTGLCFLFL